MSHLQMPILARFDVFAAVTQVSWNCLISSRHLSATVDCASSLSLSTSLRRSSKNSSLPCKTASKCDLVSTFHSIIGVMKKTACIIDNRKLASEMPVLPGYINTAVYNVIMHFSTRMWLHFRNVATNMSYKFVATFLKCSHI